MERGQPERPPSLFEGAGFVVDLVLVVVWAGFTAALNLVTIPGTQGYNLSLLVQAGSTFVPLAVVAAGGGREGDVYALRMFAVLGWAAAVQRVAAWAARLAGSRRHSEFVGRYWLELVTRDRTQARRATAILLGLAALAAWPVGVSLGATFLVMGTCFVAGNLFLNARDARLADQAFDQVVRARDLAERFRGGE